MFDQVFENLRKATEASIQMQQELFKKWVSLWPGGPTPPVAVGEPVTTFQKKWAEVVGELVKRQRETLETQFSAGLRNLEEAFRLADAKDPEELRVRAIELWQKSFECLRQLSDAQARDYQSAVGEWAKLMAKGAA
jgi:hypothetical protein